MISAGRCTVEFRETIKSNHAGVGTSSGRWDRPAVRTCYACMRADPNRNEGQKRNRFRTLFIATRVRAESREKSTSRTVLNGWRNRVRDRSNNAAAAAAVHVRRVHCPLFTVPEWSGFSRRKQLIIAAIKKKKKKSRARHPCKNRSGNARANGPRWSVRDRSEWSAGRFRSLRTATPRCTRFRETRTRPRPFPR